MKLFTNVIKKEESPSSTLNFEMNKPMWNILSDLHMSQKKLNAACAVLVSQIKLGYLQAEDFSELRGIADTIRTYGASEGLIACVNENDQLARCLGIAIPEVTALNSQSVGISCVEAIAEKLECSCGLTCKFLKDLAGNVSSFMTAFTGNVECQKETLKTINGAIINSVKYIDAAKFATAEICGYAKPVFFERVAAINEIIDGIAKVSSVEDAQSLIPALQKLGYVVEQTIEVRPETDNEAKATEPAPEEVMSAPVTEAEKSEEELEGPVGAAAPVETKTASDACQVQEVAVLRWTPGNISEACTAVINVLDKAEGIVAIGKRVDEIIAATVAECDKEGDKDEEVRAKIDADRRFVSFLSSVLHILGNATNELVDQVVGMSAVMKKFEAEKEDDKNIVEVATVTEEKPLADRCSKAGFRYIKKFVNEAEPPMGVENTEEGTQPAVAPAPEQKEVEQPKPADAEPDPAMGVEPKEEGLPKKPADLPDPEGEKVQPQVEDAYTKKPLSKESEEEAAKRIKEKIKSGDVKTIKIGLTKDEGGFVEDPIVSTPVNPEAQPVLPEPVNTPEVVPPAEPVTPAEPAQPEAPVVPVAPTEPQAPAPTEPVTDPVVAPTVAPAIQNNVNGDEPPKAVPAPAEPVEPPKGAEPVELDPALNKPVTDPVPEEKIVPAGEEKPATEVKPLQEPEKTNPSTAEAKAKGKLWF